MIDEVLAEGKSLYSSIKSIEMRLHGIPEGYDGDGKDTTFSSHMETVKSMVEKRVQDHDIDTTEGAILRDMELCLAAHGIFDAAVASALVPLCADISPDLSECLMHFRVKQAEIVSDLSKCITRMNDLREKTTQKVKEKTSFERMKQQNDTNVSLEVPESDDETLTDHMQQLSGSYLEAEPHHAQSFGAGSPMYTTPHVRTESLSSTRDPHPRISPGRHFDGEPSPRKHFNRDSSPSPPSKSGFNPPSSPIPRKGWSPAIFKQRPSIPSPDRAMTSRGPLGKPQTSQRMKKSRNSGDLDGEDLSIGNSRIFSNLLSEPMNEEKADLESSMEASDHSRYYKRLPTADSKQLDEPSKLEKLRCFRSYLRSAYPMRKVSTKKLGLRDVLYIVDKLMQSKKVEDGKVLARAMEFRKDTEAVEKLKGLMAANEASGEFSKLSSQQLIMLSNHENDPSKSKVPRVDTMEAHVYKYFEKRYGVLQLAAEHAAIFMRSVEYYASPAEAHQDPKMKRTGGLYHDRKHTSHSGEGMCRTFLSILLNEVDEGFYDKQKDRQEKMHALLLTEIRRESPNISAAQAQTRLNSKLHGWLSKEEYMHFVKTLFGEEELVYDVEDEEFSGDEDDYHRQPVFSVGLSKPGIASAEALDRGKQRRQGLVVGEGRETDEAAALYDGRAARRSAKGGRVSAPLMLLLKKLAEEERDREVEAATISKVVDKSNGSLGNQATMSYLTYHASVLSSPVKKLHKSRMVTECWNDNNRGSKVRTADFINTVLIYQLMAYVEYLMPLRQAFHARDYLSVGVLATKDIVKVFYEDLRHQDYHILPSKYSLNHVTGTFGGLRPGASEASMMKKSHDTARQRALNDLLRQILTHGDPHQAGECTFSDLVKGFVSL